MDVNAIKLQQQRTWATGDFAVIGWNTVFPGELMCEAVGLRAGQRVLDVAMGSGNTALSAAREPPIGFRFATSQMVVCRRSPRQ